MSWIGDLLGNEVSHVGDLFHNFSGKNAEQLLLGAADPLSAKLWGGITGQKFTPMVGQLGGETQAQYDESAKQGVNVGPAETMGAIANTIAGAEAGGYFGGGSSLGSLFTQGSNALSGTSSGSSSASSSSGNSAQMAAAQPDYFQSLFNFGPGSVSPNTSSPTLASVNYPDMLLNGLG